MGSLLYGYVSVIIAMKMKAPYSGTSEKCYLAGFGLFELGASHPRHRNHNETVKR